MTRWNISIAAAAVLALPALARAGVVVDMQEHGTSSTFTTEGKKLRVDQGGDHPGIMIFDGDAQKFYQIHPAEKTYTEMTQADAKVVADQMQEMLARIPPEQRAKVQAMMGQRHETTSTASEHAVEYEPSGAKQTVAGYACVGYRVVRHGKSEEEGCFIPWSANVVRKDDMTALVEMGRFMEKFMAGAYGGAGGQPRGQLHLVEEMQRAPGFPALMERVEGGKRTTESRLVTVKRVSVPSDRFQVPAGFTKVPLHMLGNGGGPGAR